jgi:NAD(P)-dependent dehydrogenase (short-subunit alcohol dehydrogenase family)
MTALGRFGAPDDVGPMDASLLGPDNRWVTGQPGLCVRQKAP